MKITHIFWKRAWLVGLFIQTWAMARCPFKVDPKNWITSALNELGHDCELKKNRWKTRGTSHLSQFPLWEHLRTSTISLQTEMIISVKTLLFWKPHLIQTRLAIPESFLQHSLITSNQYSLARNGHHPFIHDSAATLWQSNMASWKIPYEWMF